MPGDSTARHPSGLQLRFTEDDHKYEDETGRVYTSVTTLLHDFFPPFDKKAIATRCASRTGRSPESFLKEWEEAGVYGTRVHENCEFQMLGQYDKMHQPQNAREQHAFFSAWNSVDLLKQAFKFFASEMIVFSPRFRIAGSIDLLMWEIQILRILDWKTNKAIRHQAYGNKVGTQFPTRNLPDCNLEHYALQLAIYELLLKIEGYIMPNQPTKRDLLWFNPEREQADMIPLPDRSLEASQILLFHMSKGMDVIPF